MTATRPWRRKYVMRRALFLIGVFVCLSVIVAKIQSQPESAKQAPVVGQPAADRSADEAAIRANIEQFVTAYHAHDAKEVAALFTPDGQIEDKDGNVTEGREAIAQVFAGLFAEAPQKRIEVFVDSIRLIGPDLAVEVGTTKETPAPNEPAEYDRYTVLHVKRDSKWQMALARDEEGPIATPQDRKSVV